MERKRIKKSKLVLKFFVYVKKKNKIITYFKNLKIENWISIILALSSSSNWSISTIIASSIFNNFSTSKYHQTWRMWSLPLLDLRIRSWRMLVGCERFTARPRFPRCVTLNELQGYIPKHCYQYYGIKSDEIIVICQSSNVLQFSCFSDKIIQ